MPGKAQDDDFVMELVESALTKPPDQREHFLKGACTDDPELFDRAWSYVRSEERMGGFLLDPICQPFAPEHTFQPGEILEGRFRIVREVAQGGMGVVYEAIDEKLKRRIAIKCAKAGFRQQLPPEVRNASEISHPNVCRIFEIHTASTRRGEIDFVTMEFLEGETLMDRLRRSSRPETEQRDIALQLCAGLAEAHSKGVIHGDLKSGNIILTEWPDGSTRAVITDFGLAHGQAGIDGIAQKEVRGGTPDYMAPELLRGERASVTSDIYALGVILHELGCGRKPIRSGDPSKARFDSKQSGVSAKWNSIVERCLEVDPARRFQTAEQVAQAFAPSRAVRWVAVTAATAIVAIATGWITYQNAAPPKETVRLAMLPITSSPIENLSRDVSNRLARLSGGSRANLTVISPQRILDLGVDSVEEAVTFLNATHVLRVDVPSENNKIILHAHLTDVRSGVDREWIKEYKSNEVRYIPIALAGFVTSKLHLPPLEEKAAVNAAAKADYEWGLADSKETSKIDAALDALERAVAADPDSPLTHAALAEARWMKYRRSQERSWLEQAQVAAEKAAIRNPDLLLVHRIAGLLEMESGQYENAILEFQRALELNQRDSETLTRLGLAFESNDQPDEALGAFNNAVNAEPDNIRVYHALGAYYYHRAQPDKAIERLKDFVKRAPNRPEAHFALAGAYTNAGLFEYAEKELRTAIKLHDSPEFEHALGYSLMHQGRDQEAIQSYERALSLGDDTALLYINLGVSYGQTKNLGKARQAFQKGLRLANRDLRQNPKDGRARSRLAYLEARLEDRISALKEAALASSLSRNDQDTRWMVAATYEVLGQHALTLELLRSTPAKMLPGLLGELKRYPEMEALRQNSDFQRMAAQHNIQ